MKKNMVRAAFSMFMLIVLTTSAYPQWVQTNWPASNSFFDLYTGQGIVFARIWDSLNGGRVFFTDNNDTSWTQISSADSDIDILSIVIWNNNILAGTWDGFYRCTLDDIYWEPFAPTGIPADTAIWSTAIIDNTLFAGAMGNIYESSIDDANTWTEVSAGIPANARITSIVTNGNAIFAGSDCNGIFIATNGGTSWTAINSGLTDTHISQLAAVGTKLFAVTLKGVFVSDVNGTGWVSDANDTIWAADNSGLKNINCLLPVNNLLFAGTDSNGVHLSADSGLTWTPFSSGMPAGTRVWSLAASGDNIFAGTSSGIWCTPLPELANSAPAVATRASASPSLLTDKTTSLSVLGADDGGGANIVYTWAISGTPPASVTFIANGTNAAKTTTAIFTKAGG